MIVKSVGKGFSAEWISIEIELIYECNTFVKLRIFMSVKNDFQSISLVISHLVNEN